MKKLLFRKSLLLILYTLIYIYFMIFNWQVFTVTLNVNLGFGVVNLPPFIIMFLLGFTIIGILSWISYISNLQRMIYELEQGVELGKMKEKVVRNKIQEQLGDKKTIDLLRANLGIQELRDRQEELNTLIQKLIETYAEGAQVNQKDQNQKDS